MCKRTYHKRDSWHGNASLKHILCNSGISSSTVEGVQQDGTANLQRGGSHLITLQSHYTNLGGHLNVPDWYKEHSRSVIRTPEADQRPCDQRHTLTCPLMMQAIAHMVILQRWVAVLSCPSTTPSFRLQSLWTQPVAKGRWKFRKIRLSHLWDVG